MSGVEFIRKARDLRPSLTAILLTGHASLETAQEAIRSGVDAYLTKPVNLETLEETLAAELRKTPHGAGTPGTSITSPHP